LGGEWAGEVRDLGGFPKELYQVQCPVPGEPDLNGQGGEDSIWSLKSRARRSNPVSYVRVGQHESVADCHCASSHCLGLWLAEKVIPGAGRGKMARAHLKTSVERHEE
jgi:hypothetical protein